MMAHIVLISGGLSLRLAQGGHLRLCLLQLPLHQGIQQLCLGPPLELLTVGGGINHVKQPYHSGKRFRYYLAAGVEKVGIDGRGVGEKVENDGQAAKEEQGLGGFGRRAPGGGRKIPLQQQKNGDNDDRIDDLSRQL